MSHPLEQSIPAFQVDGTAVILHHSKIWDDSCQTYG